VISSRKVRVAVIGAGNMGRHHIRNYSVLPDADLIAVADKDPSTSSLAKKHRASFYADYKKMINEHELDAVSIVAPTPLHFEIGSYCMERGIHCLIEKPIAYSVDEADNLIDLSKKKKVVLTVGHIERYNPIIRKINELIKEGGLGKILSITCKRVGGFPASEPNTDVIIDLAVHDIDIINFLLNDKPRKITSHGSRTHHSKKIDAAEILLDYGSTAGFIQANWVTPVKIRTIAITGSKGYIEGNYITQELIHYKNNMQNVKNGFKNFVVNLGEPEKEVIEVDFEEPLAVELKHFLNAVQGKDDPDIVDPLDAREALRLALQAVEPYN
jgi:UDP-N-acetylglucosamine 3-dehydrogenase